jgi:uncharacterized protein YbbC (DUF1343 family)
MLMMNGLILLKTLFCFLLVTACYSGQEPGQNTGQTEKSESVITGAAQTEVWFPLVKNKRIALIANQTSIVGDQHLVDTIFNSGLNLVRIFGPEHGFRGDAADGVWIENQPDPKTGTPVVSLYGNKKKPSKEDLKDIDVVVFDIQDVGTRFYTYISTMSYAMEACAEYNIEFMVLDRPNPNGDFVDGPILDPKHTSFVGLHPVPVVHGLTVGEYARMVNGENWLGKGLKCSLTVIPVKNYTHSTPYDLPVAPSPNLPNMTAIYLYPSLCFFEGTIISIGRGTDKPFQLAGHPGYKPGSYTFVPADIPGVAKNPKYEGQSCNGYLLEEFAEDVVKKERRLHLNLLISFYNYFKDQDGFFTSYFEKLAGTDQLRNQIINGVTENQIRRSWEQGIIEFKTIRQKYLLYPDFE